MHNFESFFYIISLEREIKRATKFIFLAPTAKLKCRKIRNFAWTTKLKCREMQVCPRTGKSKWTRNFHGTK